MREAGVHKIGTDALNLSDDVTLSGEGDSDDEHDTAAADNDSEHRQPSAELIRAQRLKRQMPGLGPVFRFASYV